MQFFVIDINELNLPKTCQMEFPDQDDLLNFKLIISPDEVRRTKSIFIMSVFPNFIIFSAGILQRREIFF